jgi:CheY-like chemotaxis protein
MSAPFTTSEVARLCGVSQHTAIHWVERGELAAYKSPEQGIQRVLAADLRHFMHKHAMPEPAEWQDRSRRILIAEDEPGMAHAIRRVLTRAGFETAIGSDGFLAGSLLHTFRPALMTLDLRMPGIDGHGVLRFLRDTPPPFPLKVLVISAEPAGCLEAARALGADGVLSKPFDNEALLEAVHALLGKNPARGEGGGAAAAQGL